MQPQKTKLVVVSGATASGKTTLGVELAKKLGGEVVSADSMQIYKGIPVATAQPTEEEKQGIPHHLMAFLDVGTPFSVADYCDMAHKTIADITARGKLPIVVGGTGLYINSLVDDIAFSEIGNTEIRATLEESLNTVGAEELYKELCKVDPTAAKKINPKNTRRVIRALEVFKASGIPFSKHVELSRTNPSRYNTIWLNITFKNREILYDRINRRVDIMLQNGLVEEALKFCGIGNESGAGQAIGHKELYPYFSGEIDLATAVENLKTATRHYAKRQITWFSRRNDTIQLEYGSNMLEKALNIINN